MADKPAETSRDARSIRAMLAAALEAFKRGDIDAYMALHSDDAVVLAPNRLPEIGKDAIRRATQNLFDGSHVQENRTIDEITISGNWAFVRGSYQSVVTPKNGGSPSGDAGKYIEILCKKKGEWKYARSMWNSNGR